MKKKKQFPNWVRTLIVTIVMIAGAIVTIKMVGGRFPQESEENRARVGR